VVHFAKAAKHLLFTAAAILAIIWCESIAQSAAPLISLSINGHRIEAEVAANTEARRVGLMKRPSLPADRGMLFIFPDAGAHCMWMESTLIPLSVAFIDDTFRIINIADMQPGSQSYHCAAGPAWYALETNAGWYKLNGIGPGDRVDGLHMAPPVE